MQRTMRMSWVHNQLSPGFEKEGSVTGWRQKEVMEVGSGRESPGSRIRMSSGEEGDDSDECVWRASQRLPQVPSTLSRKPTLSTSAL